MAISFAAIGQIAVIALAARVGRNRVSPGATGVT
jgi:hypothetical protein